MLLMVRYVYIMTLLEEVKFIFPLYKKMVVSSINEIRNAPTATSLPVSLCFLFSLKQN